MSARRGAHLAALLAVALLAVACAPPPPPPPPLYATIPDNWGDSLRANHVDVAYGPHEQHRLDVYRAARGPRRGTIVHLHGGGWSGGSKIQAGIPRVVLHQTHRGYDLVAINYRLTGHAPYPAAVIDVGAAVEWLREHGTSVGVDTSRIILAGFSAGGHLATLAATAANNTTSIGALPQVAGAVSLAGVYDFNLFRFPILADWLGSTARGHASPVHWLDRDDPPILSAHGTEDGIVSVQQHRRLVQRARAIGADVTDITVDHPGLAPRCRNHEVSCGVPIARLNQFLDGLT